MKRLCLLTAIAAVVVYALPNVTFGGGGHHHGHHGHHFGSHHHFGHHHHSRSHFSFGFSHYRPSYYSYQSHYRTYSPRSYYYSRNYAVTPRYYSYYVYPRIRTSSYPLCSTVVPSVRPSTPLLEKPKVDPAPPVLPADKSPANATAAADSNGNVHFIAAQAVENVIGRNVRPASAAADSPISYRDHLGPRLKQLEVNPLFADEEAPWVVDRPAVRTPETRRVIVVQPVPASSTHTPTSVATRTR